MTKHSGRDLKQAVLQIRIIESDRDALRFHRLKDKDKYSIGTYRFMSNLWINSIFFPAWGNNRAPVE